MPRLLFDFSDPLAVQAWRSIDDRVMGGASVSRLQHDAQGHAVFHGTVSLAHGGGFASVRCAPSALGLAGAKQLVLELRGDPVPFKLSLLTGDGFDLPSYQAVFTPDGGPWQTLHLPLAGFSATFRGRGLAGAPALDPAQIRQIGLLTARREAGPFALALRSIVLA